MAYIIVLILVIAIVVVAVRKQKFDQETARKKEKENREYNIRQNEKDNSIEVNNYIEVNDNHDKE